MGRKNECEMSKADVGGTLACFFVIPIAIVIILTAIFSLTGCSHMSQTKSAEKAVAVAHEGQRQANSDVMRRVSDFGSMAKYSVSLLPVSPEQTAATKLLDLQFELTGPGRMTEQARRDFVLSIIKDDARAHRLLYEESRKNTDALAKVEVANKRADDAEFKLSVVSEKSASIADQATTAVRIVLAILVIAFAYFAIRLLILWSQTAANVATKLP